jgi:hypothetical protein
MISDTADIRKVKNANSHKLTSLSTIEIRMMIVLISIQANKNVSKAIDFFILFYVLSIAKWMESNHQMYTHLSKHFRLFPLRQRTADFIRFPAICVPTSHFRFLY